ncbi:polysaccharide deacetylase family protein [Salinibacillus xinjiangensis]|uniref:Polysaccharide deacetylase family protein n=2 Tax=Salinibacillus xinjiangensis TaxID=1229268 RepID=A0A6G1X3L8_9BACI|nr:polysaccharide deacetylase family protein [Salinibacillus xinjiangensis]
MLLLLFFTAACGKNEEEGMQDGNENPETNEVEEEEQQETENQESGKEQQEEGNEETPSESTEEEAKPEEQEPEDKNVKPMYEVSDVWSIKPIDEKANEKVVLLTIDDAPEEYAVDMAKTLKELNAPAIFFVNGHFIDTEEEQARLKEIADMGFAIGNHTYNHTKLDEVSEEEQRKEVVELNDLIEKVIGERPKFFRAPHGVNTDYVKTLVKEEGMTLMNWSYGYDFKADYMTEDSIRDIMINTELLSDGANLLMHDREWTAAALADIVTGLRDKGYEMVDPNLIQTP